MTSMTAKREQVRRLRTIQGVVGLDIVSPSRILAQIHVPAGKRPGITCYLLPGKCRNCVGVALAGFFFEQQQDVGVVIRSADTRELAISGSWA